MTDTQTWFEAEDLWEIAPDSPVNARSLLDAPAGGHGRLTCQKDRFVFEDGVPMVIFGTNVTEKRVHQGSDMPAIDAKRLAGYGINLVRFHKFTWPHSGVVTADGPSTRLDPVKMDAMDRYFHALKQEGIYVGWSPIFGHMVNEADSLASGFVGKGFFYEMDNSYSLVNFAEDLQELLITLTVNLLSHHNPYTGMKYALDPALAFVELQNEDNIFFCSQYKADAFPFYRKLLNEMFCAWLKQQYGSCEKLLDAWGKEAFQKSENLENGSIYAYSDRDLLTNQSLREHPATKRRMLDSARFLHEIQNKFYARYTEAIRETGYEGVIIGSPWLAGEDAPHYYNLKSDAIIGPVDRHQYWGEGQTPGSYVVAPGAFLHEPMVKNPGSGLLGECLKNRVVTRPFTLSEWMSTPPNEYIAEAPFLMAVYGLGLQGFGGVMSYAADHLHNKRYDINIPVHLAQYPTLARMLHRGDVREGKYVAVTRIDTATFLHDPQIDDDVARELIAVGKVGVSFENDGVRTVDASKFWDREKKRIISATGQMTWDYSGNGLVTLNTAGTQGFLGFAQGKTVETADLIIKDIQTGFANLTVGSLTREGIEKSGSLLVTALARWRFTGMEYNEDRTELVEIGREPMLMEPVEATIVLKGCARATVHALNAKGLRTGKTVPVEAVEAGAAFRIGGSYTSFWYEVQKQ